MMLFVGLATRLYAVPEEVQAQAKRALAEKYLATAEQLCADKKFYDAARYAESAKSLMGKTNPNLEYLLAKSYIGVNSFEEARKAMEAFFSLNPDKKSKLYSEMLIICAELDGRENIYKNRVAYEKIEDYVDALLQKHNECDVLADKVKSTEMRAKKAKDRRAMVDKWNDLLKECEACVWKYNKLANRVPKAANGERVNINYEELELDKNYSPHSFCHR
jgi:hypothetical protein